MGDGSVASGILTQDGSVVVRNKMVSGFSRPLKFCLQLWFGWRWLSLMMFLTILNDSETGETEVATPGVKLLFHSHIIFHNDSDHRLWRRVLEVTLVDVRVFRTPTPHNNSQWFRFRFRAQFTVVYFLNDSAVSRPQIVEKVPPGRDAWC